jgi:hypothetical protein
MANTFVWALGFRFDAAANDSGEFSLSTGFEKNGNPASSMTEVKTGDTLAFHLFNTNPEITGTFTISDVSIEFRNALAGTILICPFSDTDPFTLGDGTTTTPQTSDDGNPTIQVGSHVQSEEPATSETFSPSAALPLWFVTQANTLSHAGDFVFGITLTIEGPDGSGGTTPKIFTADPEMVVGSGNQGPDGGDN